MKSRGNEIKEAHQNWRRTTNSDVLLIDGTNTFIRCWSANPAMDENGKIRKHLYISLRNPSEKWSKYLFEYDNMDYSRFNEITNQS